MQTCISIRYLSCHGIMAKKFTNFIIIIYPDYICAYGYSNYAQAFKEECIAHGAISI